MSYFFRNLIFKLLISSQLLLYIQIAEASEFFERGTVEIVTSNGSHRVIVELAKTQAQRQRGLMWRENVPINTGMLFMFETLEMQNMWMINTKIPLDMLFIDSERRIIKVEKNTKPLSKNIISSEIPALWVLELRGGTSTRLGLKVGDKIRLFRDSN